MLSQGQAQILSPNDIFPSGLLPYVPEVCVSVPLYNCLLCHVAHKIILIHMYKYSQYSEFLLVSSVSVSLAQSLADSGR